MEERRGVSVGVLAERLRGVQEDVADLRLQQREDHHRLRSVESSVTLMLDAHKLARESEARQYAKMANAIQFGALLMAGALVALGIITILTHTG